MYREYVDSSMITSIGYEPETSTLEIEFKSNGAVWQYFDFPESLWYDFKGAESHGKFFRRMILKQYSESRIS